MAKFIRMVLVLFIIIPCVNAWAGKKSVAKAKGYFDIATSHKYIRNGDGTYTEYSKKGHIIKENLCNTSTLLVTGKHIYEMQKGCFLAYGKMNAGKLQYRYLPVFGKHPKNWRCNHLLVSEKERNRKRQTGLAYTISRESVQYNGNNFTATGHAYFDLATGNRYIKNTDRTYTEFSRKGKLLRSDVSCKIPLLSTSWHICDLNNTDYIVYEKYKAGEMIRKILLADQNHPEGWSAKDVLRVVR